MSGIADRSDPNIAALIADSKAARAESAETLERTGSIRLLCPPSGVVSVRTLLVIEDERAVVDMMRMLGRNAGLRVMTTETVPGALEIMKRPDAHLAGAVVDWRLRNGNAEAAVAALKAMHTPTVIYTAAYEDASAAKPGVDIIEKPSTREIAAWIEQVARLSREACR